MKCGDEEFRVGGRWLKVAHHDLDKYESVRDPGSMTELLRQSKARVDLFTFMQIMPDVQPKFHYHMEMDNLAILPVSTFDNWWNNQIRSYPRNRARQAEKRGVIIREVPFDDALAEGIWKVYNETKVRQGKPNRHYGKSLEIVRNESATYLDRSVFIGAFLEGEMIGFVKMIIDSTRTQASLMNIVGMVSHRDKAPTNALIAQSVRSCAERGIPYLMYQNFEYGKRGADSLTTFKEINGFQKVDAPRYYIPLTPLGRWVLKTGLHHGVVDKLPRTLTSRMRQLRTSWYNRKTQGEAKAS